MWGRKKPEIWVVKPKPGDERRTVADLNAPTAAEAPAESIPPAPAAPPPTEVAFDARPPEWEEKPENQRVERARARPSKPPSTPAGAGLRRWRDAPPLPAGLVRAAAAELAKEAMTLPRSSFATAAAIGGLLGLLQVLAAFGMGSDALSRTSTESVLNAERTWVPLGMVLNPGLLVGIFLAFKVRRILSSLAIRRLVQEHGSAVVSRLLLGSWMGLAACAYGTSFAASRLCATALQGASKEGYLSVVLELPVFIPFHESPNTQGFPIPPEMLFSSTTLAQPFVHCIQLAASCFAVFAPVSSLFGRKPMLDILGRAGLVVVLCHLSSQALLVALSDFRLLYLFLLNPLLVLFILGVGLVASFVLGAFALGAGFDLFEGSARLLDEGVASVLR